MPGSLTTVVLSAFVPVATAAVGATYAAFRPPSAKLRSAIQHFAAGVVFSVVAVELLPDVVRVHDPLEIGLSFAAGLALMLLLERLAKRSEAQQAKQANGTETLAGSATGQIVAIGIDIFIDGLLVGIAFAAGGREGILLTIALSIELLSLGLALASTLTGAGRARAILIPTGLALLLVAGAVAGDTVLRGASEHTLAGVLSFGSAALLYLVTEELLVEAHEVSETTFATTMFFAGFLLLLLLGMVASKT